MRNCKYYFILFLFFEKKIIYFTEINNTKNQGQGPDGSSKAKNSKDPLEPNNLAPLGLHKVGATNI
jgi:hypothetical protein